MRTALSFVLTILLTLPSLSAAWTWHNPYPAGNTLNAVAWDGVDTFAMAGEGGLLIDYASGAFGYPDFGTLQTVHDIELTATGGVAACERSDVLIRSGDDWQISRPASTAWFYGAAISPDGDIWVCGDSGQIHRYSDDAWQQTASSTTSTLKDIEMVSGTRGWAVGLFGTARVWNGTSWQYVSSQTTRFLRSVSGYSESCAWAVGDLGTIIRWTGTGFVTETGVNTENLYDVAAVSETEAWAVGDNATVLHRTDAGWSLYEIPALELRENFRSIAVAGPDSIMVVGQNGLIYHFDGTSWTALPQDALERAPVMAVHYASVSGRILIGSERGQVFEYDAGVFIQQPTGVADDILYIGEDTFGVLWAGGFNGRLLRNAGAGWVDFPTGDTEDIYDMDFLPSGDIWTAGGANDAGCVSWAVLHYTGSNWVKYGESGS